MATTRVIREATLEGRACSAEVRLEGRCGAYAAGAELGSSRRTCAPGPRTGGGCTGAGMGGSPSMCTARTGTGHALPEKQVVREKETVWCVIVKGGFCQWDLLVGAIRRLAPVVECGTGGSESELVVEIPRVSTKKKNAKTMRNLPGVFLLGEEGSAELLRFFPSGNRCLGACEGQGNQWRSSGMGGGSVGRFGAPSAEKDKGTV